MAHRRQKTSAGKAFVTFSSKAFHVNPGGYVRLIDLVERRCGFAVPYRWFDIGEGRLPDEIHRRSLRAIREADIVVAESSSGSTGLGLQISYAIQCKKPVFLCMRKELERKSNHSFLKGMRVSNVRFIYYADGKELESELRRELADARTDRLEKFNFIATTRVKDILNRESRRRHMSQSELLREIIEDWIGKNHNR
ncbi:MAG: hypothetical protein HY567_04705 [Candidatus Kerfeldbacteria bacterium]|nr:hypothetical protein [Candidatus Kerfeldbacteria bacterium]